MRVLLDTHAMLWWLSDDRRLSETARETLGDGRSELLWSVASSWETAIKTGMGRLEMGRPLLEQLYAEIVGGQGAVVVPVTHEHCLRIAQLPFHHRDPFDRMLVAQALELDVALLSADPKLDQYGVDRRW